MGIHSCKFPLLIKTATYQPEVTCLSSAAPCTLHMGTHSTLYPGSSRGGFAQTASYGKATDGQWAGWARPSSLYPPDHRAALGLGVCLSGGPFLGYLYTKAERERRTALWVCWIGMMLKLELLWPYPSAKYQKKKTNKKNKKKPKTKKQTNQTNPQKTHLPEESIKSSQCQLYGRDHAKRRPQSHLPGVGPKFPGA